MERWSASCAGVISLTAARAISFGEGGAENRTLAQFCGSKGTCSRIAPVNPASLITRLSLHHVPPLNRPKISARVLEQSFLLFPTLEIGFLRVFVPQGFITLLVVESVQVQKIGLSGPGDKGQHQVQRTIKWTCYNAERSTGHRTL